MYSFNNKSKTIRTMKKYIQPEVQERKSLINNPILLDASDGQGNKIIGEDETGTGTSGNGIIDGDAKLRDEWSDGLW